MKPQLQLEERDGISGVFILWFKVAFRFQEQGMNREREGQEKIARVNLVHAFSSTYIRNLVFLQANRFFPSTLILEWHLNVACTAFHRSRNLIKCVGI